MDGRELSLYGVAPGAWYSSILASIHNSQNREKENDDGPDQGPEAYRPSNIPQHGGVVLWLKNVTEHPNCTYQSDKDHSNQENQTFRGIGNEKLLVALTSSQFAIMFAWKWLVI